MIDEPMKALGCCCGQKPRFRPMPLYCFSSLACCIPVNTAYYSCQDKYVFVFKLSVVVVYWSYGPAAAVLGPNRQLH